MKRLVSFLLLMALGATADDDISWGDLLETPERWRPTKNFWQADVDKNKRVTRDEFFAQRKRWAERRGRDHDEEQTRKIFLKKDLNKNGELDPKEYQYN